MNSTYDKAIPFIIKNNQSEGNPASLFRILTHPASRKPTQIDHKTIINCLRCRTIQNW